MHAVESSAAARAENGKTAVERSNNIRIGCFAFNIGGSIIERGRSDAEFVTVKRFIIGDNFINAFFQLIQILL